MDRQEYQHLLSKGGDLLGPEGLDTLRCRRTSITSWTEISIELSECSAGSRKGKSLFVLLTLVCETK